MVAITVSGKIGSGKSTLAKKLAACLNLEYFSVGRQFRVLAEKEGLPIEEFIKKSPEDLHIKIDNKMKEVAKTRNVVIDARLAGWMVPDADLKIFLTAPLKTRAHRIMKNRHKRIAEEKKDSETWVDESVRREKIEWEKYNKLYGIDLNDLNGYDLVLNTERIGAEDLLEIVELVIKKAVKL